MADIRDILNTIKYALYGKDVRQAIHDGILKCYEDGKAGADDIIARQEIADMKNPSISGSLAQQIDTLNKKNVYWDGVDSNKSFLQMVLEYYQTYGATTLVEGFYRGGQASAQTLYPNPTDWMSFKFYIVTDQVKAIFQDLEQKTYSISGTIVPEWTNNNVYGRGWNELGSSESHIYLTNTDLITYIKDKIANGVTSGSFYGLPSIIGLPDSNGYYLVTWFNNHVDYFQIIAEKFITNETVGTVYYGRYWNGLLQWSELAKGFVLANQRPSASINAKTWSSNVFSVIPTNKNGIGYMFDEATGDFIHYVFLQGVGIYTDKDIFSSNLYTIKYDNQ